MSDTPVSIPTNPPPPKLDQMKAFLGDLARPFAIAWVALCAGGGMFYVLITCPSKDLLGAASVVGAVFVGITALVIPKSAENIMQARATADVAKSAAGSTP